VLLGPTRWKKPLRILHATTLPLVIAGVVLSTLHQSSLGSLFLIMPAKVNPLWYSPLLPVFFFLTAVAVGLSMVIVESSASARAFHRGLEADLLAGLAKAVPFVLGLYLVLRLGDLAVRGSLPLIVSEQPLGVLLLAELTVGVVVPIAFFARKRNRQMPGRLLLGSLLVIAGLVLNRFNVSLLAVDHLGGEPYLPSLGELAISLGIISAGVLAFALVARFFPVFEAEGHGPDTAAAVTPPGT
jgi:Ni/Fe-hydrogenase subunit HybB-like protein